MDKNQNATKTAEDGLGDTIKPRLEQAGTDCERVIVIDETDKALTGNKAAWEQHNSISLAGMADTALLKYLDMYPKTKELVFCLDNDPAGRDATIILMRKYAEKGYFARVELPEGKDFNVDLLDYAKRATLQKASNNRYKYNHPCR